jgi:hypothetical protein
MENGSEKIGLGLVAIFLVGAGMIVFTDCSPHIMGMDLIPEWMGNREIFVISGLATMVVPWMMNK